MALGDPAALSSEELQGEILLLQTEVTWKAFTSIETGFHL